MVVARVTCHAVPCGRQLASSTEKISSPPSTASPPLGSALSSIPVQPFPVGGAHDAISASDSWPLPPPSMGRSSHQDRKSTRLNSSHLVISYAVFCLKKKTA